MTKVNHIVLVMMVKMDWKCYVDARLLTSPLGAWMSSSMYSASAGSSMTLSASGSIIWSAAAPDSGFRPSSSSEVTSCNESHSY